MRSAGMGMIGVRGLAERKGRTALTAAGITLGVALFVGALIAAATTTRGMDELAAQSAGEADVLVSPAGSADATLLNPRDGGRLTANDLARLADLPGVQAVGGLVAFPTVLATEDGRTTALAVNRRSSQAALVGTDLATGDIIDARVGSGRLPAIGALEVAVPLGLAGDLAVGPGEEITVATPTGDRTLSVVGVLDETGIGRLRTVSLTSIETARELGGVPGDDVSLAALRLTPGEEARPWVDAQREAIGPGLTVVPGTGSVDRYRTQLTMMSGSMTAMAAAVVLAGGYLIYLTLSTTVAERTRLYGTLHALGATRAQVRRVVLVEAVGMGALATAVGVGAGVLVAVALNAVTARFLTLLGSPGVHVPTWALVAGGAFGLAATLVSALLPAGRAARLDPVAAMREVHGGAPGPPPRWRTGTAAVVVAAGTWLLGTATAVATQTAALVMVLAAAIFLVAPLIGPLARGLSGLVGRVSPGTGDVAVLHLVREPSRSAHTLALVMLVMGMTFATGAVSLSFMHSLDRELDLTFPDGLMLTAASTFDDPFVAVARAHPAVEAVSPVRRMATDIVHGGERTQVYVDLIESETYFDVAGFWWVDGDDRSAQAALERGPAVVLPTPIARRLDVAPGDRILMDTSEGPASFEVAGVANITSIPPKVVAGGGNAVALLGGAQPAYLRVTVAPGTRDDEAVAALQRDLGHRATFIASTFDDLRADARAQILGVANGFFVLLVLAGAVGLVGLANTLAVSIIQRAREIGVLRAIGARRTQVGAMAVLEALALVAVAFVLAVPLGALISEPLMRTISTSIGDYAVPYVFPWVMAPFVAAVGLVVGGLAALWPARRAAATEIDAALRME